MLMSRWLAVSGEQKCQHFSSVVLRHFDISFSTYETYTWYIFVAEQESFAFPRLFAALHVLRTLVRSAFRLPEAIYHTLLAVHYCCTRAYIHELLLL